MTATLVTRDPATGLRRNPIRHPDGQPPTPFGCRRCGNPQGSHGRSYIAGAGIHTWERPTNAQILARMRARRAHRLNPAPPKYHATTRWTGTPGDPEDPGYELCADCGTENCAQYLRIQHRRALALTDRAAQTRGRVWAVDPNWPF